MCTIFVFSHSASGLVVILKPVVAIGVHSSRRAAETCSYSRSLSVIIYLIQAYTLLHYGVHLRCNKIIQRMWLQKSIITLSSSRSPFGCVHAFGENSLCRRCDCRSNSMHGNYPCSKHSIDDAITQRMPVGGHWRAAHHLAVDVRLLRHGVSFSRKMFR